MVKHIPPSHTRIPPKSVRKLEVVASNRTIPKFKSRRRDREKNKFAVNFKPNTNSKWKESFMVRFFPGGNQQQHGVPSTPSTVSSAGSSIKFSYAPGPQHPTTQSSLPTPTMLFPPTPQAASTSFTPPTSTTPSSMQVRFHYNNHYAFYHQHNIRFTPSQSCIRNTQAANRHFALQQQQNSFSFTPTNHHHQQQQQQQQTQQQQQQHTISFTPKRQVSFHLG